jgi:hypothetical protein
MGGFESWLFSPGIAAACIGGSVSMICEHIKMPRGRTFQVTVAVILGTHIIAGGRTIW